MPLSIRELHGIDLPHGPGQLVAFPPFQGLRASLVVGRGLSTSYHRRYGGRITAKGPRLHRPSHFRPANVVRFMSHQDGRPRQDVCSDGKNQTFAMYKIM